MTGIHIIQTTMGIMSKVRLQKKSANKLPHRFSKAKWNGSSTIIEKINSAVSAYNLFNWISFYGFIAKFISMSLHPVDYCQHLRSRWCNDLAHLQQGSCCRQKPGFESHLRSVKFFAYNKVFLKTCATRLNKLA